jgi:hypothetical protein
MDDDTNMSNGHGHMEKKRRKRREMQAVTTIVETRDPYNDEYMWKNNGNTLHKKTGQKSTYYKCSNSSKVKFLGLAATQANDRVAKFFSQFLRAAQ